MITQVHEIDCGKCEPGYLMLLEGEEGTKRIFWGQKITWRKTRTSSSLWGRERREVAIPLLEAGLFERLQIGDIHGDRNHPDEYDLRVEVNEFSCGCNAFKGHQVEISRRHRSWSKFHDEYVEGKGAQKAFWSRWTASLSVSASLSKPYSNPLSPSSSQPSHEHLPGHWKSSFSYIFFFFF